MLVLCSTLSLLAAPCQNEIFKSLWRFLTILKGDLMLILRRGCFIARQDTQRPRQPGILEKYFHSTHTDSYAYLWLLPNRGIHLYPLENKKMSPKKSFWTNFYWINHFYSCINPSAGGAKCKSNPFEGVKWGKEKTKNVLSGKWMKVNPTLDKQKAQGEALQRRWCNRGKEANKL